MAAAQSPLRRWERFFPVFAAIDDAIEAGGRHPRDAFRSVRGRIVELLSGAEDDAVAEQLCAALDGAMEESLATLRVAPVAASALVSTGLAKAIAALGDHESARVRSLARDVVRGWRAAVEADLSRARAAMEVLDKLSDEQQIQHVHAASTTRGCNVSVAADQDQNKTHATTTKMASVRSNRVEPAMEVKVAAPSPNKSAHAVAPSASTRKMNAAAPQLPTKTPAGGNGGSHRVRSEKMMEATRRKLREDYQQVEDVKQMPVGGNGAGNRVPSEKMMEATKRKLREGYQEVEDAKRQRKIQIIEAPKMLEQRQRKMHPIPRERSRARCGNSLAVRRSLLPSLQRI